MKIFIKTIIITIFLICGFNPLYAGSGSDHTFKVVSQTYVKQAAKKEIRRLIAAKAIDKSWQTQAVYNSEKKKFDKNLEWVVSFNNKQIKDIHKQMLYIFVNLNGILIGSNYTGE